jgi:hypothetical protein
LFTKNVSSTPIHPTQKKKMQMRRQASPPMNTPHANVKKQIISATPSMHMLIRTHLANRRLFKSRRL